MGLIPESGRSPGGGHGNPLQYSCLENPTDRGAWRATVHRVTRRRTRLSYFNTHTCTQEALQGLGHQPLQALTFVLCTPFTKAFLWIEKQYSFSCPSFWRLLPCLYVIPLAGCIFLNLQISFQMSLPPGELSWLGQAIGLSFLVLFSPHQSLRFSDSRNNMYFTYILRTWQQCPAYNSASAKQTFSSQSPGYLSVPGPASECLTFSFTGRTWWTLPGFSLARETKQVTVPYNGGSEKEWAVGPAGSCLVSPWLPLWPSARWSADRRW